MCQIDYIEPPSPTKCYFSKCGMPPLYHLFNSTYMLNFLSTNLEFLLLMSMLSLVFVRLGFPAGKVPRKLGKR